MFGIQPFTRRSHQPRLLRANLLFVRVPSCSNWTALLSGACAGGPIYFIVTCHSSGLRVGERAGTYDPCLYFSARKDVRGSHGWPVALSGTLSDFIPAGWVFATEGRLQASFVWCASSDYARAVLLYLLDSPEHQHMFQILKC